MKKIPLSGRYSTNSFALIDGSDYELISKYHWYVYQTEFRHKRGYTPYAATTLFVEGKPKVVKMHRMILDCPKSYVIDHINRNGLDNRRCNIRVCSIAENNANRKTQRNNKIGKKGIFLRSSGKFRAILYRQNKQINIGTFEKLEDAEHAYDEAVRKYAFSF